MERLHLLWMFFVDWLLHSPSRRDALRTLRTRWHRQKKTMPLPSAEEKQTAAEMCDLKEAIAEMLRGVKACSLCSRGCALPEGQWEGGFCCAGDTQAIFSDREIRMLQAGGIQHAQLQAPRSAHAGCVFRGEVGCTLQPSQRPNLCLTYICRDLSKELAVAPHTKQIAALCLQLEQKDASFHNK